MTIKTEFKEISCVEHNCTCSSERRWIVYTKDLIIELKKIRDSHQLNNFIIGLEKQMEKG